MKRVALLLDDPNNLYQRLLAREAKAAADRLGLELLEPQFASGSPWTQVEAVNTLLRAESKPDAVVAILAGGQLAKAPFERVLRAGVNLVLLNRIPDWLAELRSQNPHLLAAGVAPDQEAIGRLQAQQTLRLAKTGAFVILVTGTAASPTALLRRSGLFEGVKGQFEVHELDGAWSTDGAEAAFESWFRLGADRDRLPELVVCQNDAMAAGARRALVKQAAASGRRDLERVPLIGCDGLVEEGRAAVGRGELAATVVVPPSTPVALEVLKRSWDGQGQAALVLLDVESHPPLANLARA